MSQIFGRRQRGRPPDSTQQLWSAQESAKVLGGINTHDETLQLFALILADDIVTERGEFYRDFFRS